MSLHERLLPPEAAAILASLQQRAPSIPFETMQRQLRGELPDYDRLFRSLDPEPYAAASIGQVHAGVLWDGRRVAVKIQYPESDRIVRADPHNSSSSARCCERIRPTPLAAIAHTAVWRVSRR